MASVTPAPVLLLGINPRSGTNFLYRLISKHPSCHPANDGDILEDYLLHHAEPLYRYAETLGHFWQHFWIDDGRFGSPAYRRRHAADVARICEALGSGLLGLLAADAPDKHLVIKTPSVRNLAHVFDFFPSAKVIVLVRDGRAMTESSFRSFDWSYEYAMRRWAENAQTILDFQAAAADQADRWLLVKYEDVVRDTEAALGRIFAYLGLDAQAVEAEALADVPVLGSSQTGARGDWQWHVSDKPADFDPLQRAADWSPARHARFNWIAGAQMMGLGYTLQHQPGEASLGHRLRQSVLDIPWLLRNAVRHGIAWIEGYAYRFNAYGPLFRRLN